jgi:nucleotide-binding universal stress UspA family protein
MFDNVIVGVDGREGGHGALAAATMLCGESGAITLAYVYPLEPRAWRGTTPEYDAAQREKAQDLLEKTREESGVEAEFRVVGSPSVGRGLHELAEAVGADLLVVGSSGRRLLGRVFVADDTRAALNGAPCAVAIAPAGYSQRPATMREIGVGYDGSPESEHALGVARKLASERQATLSAFEAVSLPAYAFVGPPVPDENLIDELVQRAHQRVASLRGVEPHAAYGDPAQELALYSAPLDLLVIGSRGYGPLGRVVHGSTALELSRSARCPLLVLTRAARAADRDDSSDRRGAAQPEATTAS